MLASGSERQVLPITFQQRPLGFNIQTREPATAGAEWSAVVTKFTGQGDAEALGVRVGDQLVAFGDLSVSSNEGAPLVEQAMFSVIKGLSFPTTLTFSREADATAAAAPAPGVQAAIELAQASEHQKRLEQQSMSMQLQELLQAKLQAKLQASDPTESKQEEEKMGLQGGEADLGKDAAGGDGDAEDEEDEDENPRQRRKAEGGLRDRLKYRRRKYYTENADGTHTQEYFFGEIRCDGSNDTYGKEHVGRVVEADGTDYMAKSDKRGTRLRVRRV